MAVGRQLNVKGQMRIDVPHLRLIESGVVYDFDTLAGGILAGKLPYVVTGFVPASWIQGTAASSLSLVTADSIFVNYQASENGSMLMVPADRAPEQLTINNSRVSGNFSVGQTNYVSLDLTRTEDTTTSDVVHFIDPATGQGTPKIIPLGRTMDYQIHITTSPFSTNPQRCPVMIVVTDASNNIVSVKDARPMMFRLAAGGDTPSALSKYAWPQGRNIGVTPVNESALFTGGDKAIGDLKSWISVVEEMIWQINAGEYWYSNTQMTSTWLLPGAVSDWSWNLGTQTITWGTALKIVFTGSTAMFNTINAGSSTLLPDEAMYVDFNRYTNGQVLTVSHGPINTLGGTPATPGIRYPIAWRVGSGTPSVRNFPVPVGTSLVVGTATTTTTGTVFINTATATPYAVVSNALGGAAIATGLMLPSAGTLGIGTSTNETTILIGGGLNNQGITIGRSTSTMGFTAIYGAAVIMGTGTTGSAQIWGTLVEIGCFTSNGINIGKSSNAQININTLGTTTPTTNIGTATLGTVAIKGATAQIHATSVDINYTGLGSTSIGSLDTGYGVTVRGSNVNLNHVGSGNTTIGNSDGTGAINIVTGYGALNVNAGSGGVSINATGTGATTIGNSTSKAAATAATVFADPVNTLATKSYVDKSYAISTTSTGAWVSSPPQTALVAVTNATVTITAIGRPIFIQLIPDGTSGYANDAFVGLIDIPGAGLGTAEFAILRDGTIISTCHIQTSAATVTTAMTVAPGCISTFDIPSAGAHTYTLQACTPSSATGQVSVHNCKLVAFTV
jgi:hypothetical protein